MTSDEQLDKWVEGESIHNKSEDECCPDFSCCHPILKAARPVREKFKAADGPIRMAMLGIFLSAAFAELTDKDVYVAGQGLEH